MPRAFKNGTQNRRHHHNSGDIHNLKNVHFNFIDFFLLVLNRYKKLWKKLEFVNNLDI